MILRQATIQYKGYDPEDLSFKSRKRICCSCDQCGRVRWSPKYAYRNLCRSCIKIGKKVSDETKEKMRKSHIGITPMKDKHHSEKTKRKIGLYSKDKVGKLASNWKGGISNLDQPHLIPINQCIKLNSRFKGSEGHHINKNTVIFIPKELHNHIWHNFKSGQGMKEINILAMQFIRGEK